MATLRLSRADREQMVFEMAVNATGGLDFNKTILSSNLDLPFGKKSYSVVLVQNFSNQFSCQALPYTVICEFRPRVAKKNGTIKFFMRHGKDCHFTLSTTVAQFLSIRDIDLQFEPCQCYPIRQQQRQEGNQQGQEAPAVNVEQEAVDVALEAHQQRQEQEEEGVAQEENLREQGQEAPAVDVALEADQHRPEQGLPAVDFAQGRRRRRRINPPPNFQNFEETSDESYHPDDDDLDSSFDTSISNSSLVAVGSSEDENEMMLENPQVVAILPTIPEPTENERNLAQITNCAICWENLFGNLVGRPLGYAYPCSHFFHFDCINLSFSVSTNCPACRNEIIEIKLSFLP